MYTSLRFINFLHKILEIQFSNTYVFAIRKKIAFSNILETFQTMKYDKLLCFKIDEPCTRFILSSYICFKSPLVSIHFRCERYCRGLGKHFYKYNILLFIFSGWCPEVFDDALCWSQTPPGAIANQSCPNFEGFNTNKLAYKRCWENGSWYVNQENITWSDYRDCIDFESLEVSSF